MVVMTFEIYRIWHESLSFFSFLKVYACVSYNKNISLLLFFCVPNLCRRLVSFSLFSHFTDIKIRVLLSLNIAIESIDNTDDEIEYFFLKLFH